MNVKNMEETNKQPRKKVVQVDINDWISEEGLAKIYEWCTNGLSMKQIAHNIGISTQTFYIWLDKCEKLSDVIKAGKDKADDNVVNALYIAATVDRNVKAITFWLRNRRPTEWKEKIEQETHNVNYDNIELKID